MVGSKMMVTWSPALHPRAFRVYRFRDTTPVKLKDQVETEKLLQSVALEVDGHIDLLLRYLRNAEYLIFKEQRTVSLLEESQKRNTDCRCEPTSFIENYRKSLIRWRLATSFGPVIKSLEDASKENDKTLKRLEMGLLLHFDRSDSLLHAVKELHQRNKSASKRVSHVVFLFHDYQARIDLEVSWISEFAKNLERLSGHFSAVASENMALQEQVSELGLIMNQLTLSKVHAIRDLDTLLMLLEAIGLLLKISAWFLQDVDDLCFERKNMESILNEKIRFAARFNWTEKNVKQQSPELETLLDDLHWEVESAKKAYDKKISCLSKDSQGSGIKIYTYTKVMDNSDFSWRDRRFNGRNILPPIRTQGRGECAFVATVSATESIYKKEHAVFSTFAGHAYQPNEFVVKLSHNHLQDMVTEFYAETNIRGRNKLDVCLQMMQDRGVISEAAYNDANVLYFHRYQIKEFEALNPAAFEDACGILQNGTVLIGNFRITTDYYRVGSHDIYEIQEDAVYETNTAGQICSHCVVIVGFGVTPESLYYYIFQNSYGPGWGSGGFGRVASASISYLYSAELLTR